MTITVERYSKDGITTSLRFGFGGGQYFVSLDDVTLAQSHDYRSAWNRGLTARAALIETGWTK